MSKFVNLTGQKYGRLTVLKLHHKEQCYAKNGTKNGSRYYYLCLCDCGNQTIVRGSHLKHGKISSCGCYLKERRVEGNIIHNFSTSRIYKIWRKMKERCFYKKSIRYSNYGGRGITICDEWLQDFMNFYNWSITNGYADNLTIDRIDTNKNYEPSNCRWITNKEQQRNTRQNHLITYKGKTHCISEWAEIYDINYYVLWARLFKLNWSAEKALTQPKKTHLY